MRYIIIGLGRFGSNLASNLTEMGHEVIGIDRNPERLDELKDSVTTVMKMDTTNINAIKSLPLNDTDAVIVAIGQDVGASVLTISILKNLKVSRIIGRAINRMHYDILKQLGIEEVVLPLEESARHVSAMLQIKNILKLTEINNEFAVAEVLLPVKYVGHSLKSVNMENRFNLRLLAVKIQPEENMLTTIFRRNYRVFMEFDINRPLEEKIILVLAGKIVDIKRFVES